MCLFYGTLLAHVQLDVHQDPDPLFCQAAFLLGGPWRVLMPGVVPPQVEDLTLHCVHLCELMVLNFSSFPQFSFDDEVRMVYKKKKIYHLNLC